MNRPARYPIPAATIQIETRVSNSRFIATSGEVRSVPAAKAFIDAIRAEFPDATHHVFAYRVGYGSSVIEGLSDAGEPPGTAGRPALAVLRGADLGDVALVIARYFGGTKLGTGGLVKAYTEAAQAALDALPRARRVERKIGLMTIPYGLYERVRQLVARHEGTLIGEAFAGEVSLEATFPVDLSDEFEAALTALSAAQVAVRWKE